MPRVVVISFASVNTPHRKPYDLLSKEPGWEVHLIAPSSMAVGKHGHKPCEPAPAGAGYTLHQLPVSFVSSGRLLWFRGLSRLLWKLRPDAIFAEYDPGSLPVIHAFAASRPWGARVVSFSVENIFRDRFRDAAAYAMSMKPSEAAREALAGVLGVAGTIATSGLACISEQGAALYRDEWRWSRPLAVVPIGTDIDLFKPLDVAGLRRSLGLQASFVIGYFGRLMPEKGVMLLVEALAQSPGRFRLLLDVFRNFLPGSYAALVMNRATDLGVKDRIVCIDVPHVEVPTYMNCCDVVVLPSVTTERWKEQFGRVLPEAMACGVPVIGSDSGNIPAMIGEAGVVVPEASSVAIARAVEALADDPARRDRLRFAGRRRVEQHFSVAVQVQKMKALLADRP